MLGGRLTVNNATPSVRSTIEAYASLSVVQGYGLPKFWVWMVRLRRLVGLSSNPCMLYPLSVAPEIGGIRHRGRWYLHGGGWNEDDSAKWWRRCFPIRVRQPFELAGFGVALC